jgi:mannose-6-phosphate isomerase-like protein (cupin superfamily)
MAVCCLSSAVYRLPITTMDKINLAQKLSLIKDHWNPRIIGELNGQYLKLVKFKGPFTWHHHDAEDEMFLVVKGRFRMDFRENAADGSESEGHREVWLEEGEFIIVPRGVEHRPVADEEAEVLLFEPASTLNTGNVRDEFTVAKLEWL